MFKKKQKKNIVCTLLHAFLMFYWTKTRYLPQRVRGGGGVGERGKGH